MVVSSAAVAIAARAPVVILVARPERNSAAAPAALWVAGHGAGLPAPYRSAPQVPGEDPAFLVTCNAAEDRWQDWDQPGPIVVDWNEEVDDSSSMAQTLTLFRQVVTEVASLQGADWDPVRIRAQIFGQK